MNKKNYGQFYTTNAEYITNGLLSVFEKKYIVIDPFCGKWDLLNLIENKKYGYDIDPQNNLTIKQDTLKNKIDFSGKWVITNPPYLARNKSKDKTIFDLYQTDDLYKASLLSIIGCEGGIIILPINFFSGRDSNTRREFLSKYNILKVNVFEETVFEDTSYTVCAFSFVKKDNKGQNIPFIFYPNKKEFSFYLGEENEYTIGNEIYNLKQSNVKIRRLLKGEDKPNSKIFLNAIDTGSKDGFIKLSITDFPFYGKNTDRAFATIVFNIDFSLEEQKLIVEKFNEKLNKYRNKYNSMFLTNYRNSTSITSRKRISFKLVYSLLSNIILENGLNR